MIALSQQQLSSLNDTGSAKTRVADLLSVKPNLQGCTLVHFAGVFNVSARTLQRQLKHQQCQFGQLLDHERQQRAQKLIGSVPLGELAHHLGFSEQSSFNRAFKRWHGCSPKAYLLQLR